MKKHTWVLLSTILAVFMVTVPMLAYHGTNISYDHSKTVTVTGTITEFVWQNPHTQVYFDVKDEKGNLVHWAGEMNSPGVLVRQEGWTRKTLKPGDQVISQPQALPAPRPASVKATETVAEADAKPRG